MTLREIAGRHGLPGPLVEALEKAGFGDLYPPQAEALESGVLGGGNLVLAVPPPRGRRSSRRSVW